MSQSRSSTQELPNKLFSLCYNTKNPHCKTERNAPLCPNINAHLFRTCFLDLKLHTLSTKRRMTESDRRSGVRPSRVGCVRAVLPLSLSLDPGLHSGGAEAGPRRAASPVRGSLGHRDCTAEANVPWRPPWPEASTALRLVAILAPRRGGGGVGTALLGTIGAKTKGNSE